MSESSNNIQLGIVDAVSEENYHGGAGISRSDLMSMSRSVHHFFAKKDQKPKDAPALRFGTAVHLAILEPDRYDAKYQLVNKVDKRTKEYKEIVEAGFEALSFSDHDRIMAIKASLESNPLTKNLFNDGKAEQTLYWNEPNHDVLCKARIDYLRKDGIAVDLKTTLDASPQSFRKTLANYSYDVQAAHYLAGLNNCLGETFKDFLFVAVEKEPPFGVAVYRIDDASVEAGEEIRQRLLKRYVDFMKDTKQLQNKSCYPQKVMSISLPAYGFDINSRIGDE